MVTREGEAIFQRSNKLQPPPSRAVQRELSAEGFFFFFFPLFPPLCAYFCQMAGTDFSWNCANAADALPGTFCLIHHIGISSRLQINTLAPAGFALVERALKVFIFFLKRTVTYVFLLKAKSCVICERAKTCMEVKTHRKPELRTSLDHTGREGHLFHRVENNCQENVARAPKTRSVGLHESSLCLDNTPLPLEELSELCRHLRASRWRWRSARGHPSCPFYRWQSRGRGLVACPRWHGAFNTRASSKSGTRGTW